MDRNIGKRKMINILLSITGIITIMSIILSGCSKQEEVFPSLEDVRDAIEVKVGDFKLDKQAYIGDPNAPVKVIEFMDYKCPYCAAWTTSNLPHIKKEYIDTGKVQLFLINYPFLGPDSIKAAMVGEILWKQNHDAFWEYHNALSLHQGDESTVWANEEFLTSIIDKYVDNGDSKAVKQGLKNLEGLYEVKEDFQITEANHISSVPTFWIEGKKYVNPDVIQLTQAIESILESKE